MGISVGSPPLWTWEVLIIAERTVGGMVCPDKIKEMDSELTKVIEEFDCAVNIEALHLIKETGEHSYHTHTTIHSQEFHVEQEFLLGQLKFVKAGHDLDCHCLKGTCQSILNQIVAWVAIPQEKNDGQQKNMYWLYGSPGIGKTSLAHLICANLHNQRQLAGAFFCRRDDLNLSDPRNILLSLICKLAGIFPAF